MPAQVLQTVTYGISRCGLREKCGQNEFFIILKSLVYARVFGGYNEGPRAHTRSLSLSLSHRQTGTELVSHLIVRSRRNEISRKVDVQSTTYRSSPVGIVVMIPVGKSSVHVTFWSKAVEAGPAQVVH